MGKILDNKNHGTVGDVLKSTISAGSKLSFISSCFTIYAYRELKSQLESIDELRFLFVEPAFVRDINKKEIREYEIKRGDREQNLTGTEFEIRLKNELCQGAIARECAEWLKAKVQMRSFTDSAMEPAKLYHVENDKPCVIHGNSDFTADGLGFVPSRKFFSNIYSDDHELSRNMLRQFDEFWHNDTLTEDVKNKVLDSLLNVYKENPPELLYYVTLYNIFKTYLEELDEDTVLKAKTGFKQTLIWNKLYKFQKDGALGAIDKLEKHNGCIIADSVGLGKTFEALAVIKYYELRNSRVLVLCPKKLRDNWLVYKYNDKRNVLLKDRFNYDVLNHTDLSRYNGMSGDINLEMLNWDNYDLLVIDESHNFRNNDPRKDHETRYARLMNKIINQGVKTKVLMLSATPVNNRMNDLKNQVVFITEGNDNSFSDEGIPSIERTLKTAQARFNKWCDKPESQRTLDTFLEMINFDYFKLLDTATIARSRKHIQKYYDMSEIGEFPERLKPDNIYADIDLNNGFPPLKEINRSIRLLNLGVYSPLKYVLPAKQREYSEKYDVAVKDGNSVWRQIDREENLIGLMRVNLLKRMESSIFSFALTVEKILMFVDSLLEKIEGARGVYDTDLSIVEIETDDVELGGKRAWPFSLNEEFREEILRENPVCVFVPKHIFLRNNPGF